MMYRDRARIKMEDGKAKVKERRGIKIVVEIKTAIAAIEITNQAAAKKAGEDEKNFNLIN
mgnify:CR=1 FL=1